VAVTFSPPDRDGESIHEVGQGFQPDLLPCRGNGFPAIRRRLTHGRV